MAIQLPTVHMNGTSKAELLETLGEASEALEAAYRAVKQTGPNGRDYYLLGPGEMARALTEHESRLRMIDDLKAEIEALLDGIHDGGARHDRLTVPTPARRGDDPGKVVAEIEAGPDRAECLEIAAEACAGDL